MRGTSIRASLVVLFVVGALAIVAGAGRADTSQTPNSTGCPAGYQLLNIAALEAIGPYPDSVLGGIDRAGNDNGWICGNPQPPSIADNGCRKGFTIPCELEALGLPHYVLKDDDSPAVQTGPTG